MLALPNSAGSVPRSLAQSLTELPFGSQSQIRVQDGQLSAFFAYAGYDKQVGTVKYALRVLNNTPSVAYARLFVDARGTQVSAYPCDIEIAPFSMKDDVVPVRMDVTGPFDRAIVAVSSEDNYFTVEAPPPPRTRPNWLKWSALAAIPLFAMGVAAAAVPRILDVAAPQKALAGSTLQVPFQVSGLGTVEYDFQTHDGLRLAAGLADRSGVLNLVIPHGGEGSPYQLHIRMRSLYTSAQASAIISAVVPITARAKPVPAQDGASIQDLTVTPSAVVAGNTIVAKYAALAQSGMLYLVDTSGMTWAHAPMTLTGVTRMIVPQAAAGKNMRLVLDVHSGAAHQESSVGFTVMPSEESVAQAAPQATAAPVAAATVAPVTATLTLSSQVVSPGDTVTATVSGVHGDVRITLMSASGTTMAQGDADDSSGVTLNAPTVTTPTTFYVVATLTNGVAQQSIMKRLVVTPR